MDREQLFKNLNELEKQLRGIKSATDQVNSVIESDRALVESVKGFTAEAHKLLGGIKSAYDGEVAAVGKAAMEVLRTATTQFEQKVDKISSEITRNTKELNTIVDEKLSPLVKDDLTGVIEGKLKPFVEKDMPHVVSAQLDHFSERLGAAVNGLTEAVTDFTNRSNAVLTEFAGVITSMEVPQRRMSEFITVFTEKLDEQKTMLSSAIGEISGSLEASRQTVISAIDKTGKGIIEEQAAMNTELKKVSSLEESQRKITEQFSVISDKFDDLKAMMSSSLEPKVDDISMQMSSLKQEIASMKKSCNIAFASLGILIVAIALYFFMK